MRVSDLAKELGKTSKDILDVLQKQGHDVKTHSSSAGRLSSVPCQGAEIPHAMRHGQKW